MMEYINQLENQLIAKDAMIEKFISIIDKQTKLIEDNMKIMNDFEEKVKSLRIK